VEQRIDEVKGAIIEKNVRGEVQAESWMELREPGSWLWQDHGSKKQKRWITTVFSWYKIS